VKRILTLTVVCTLALAACAGSRATDTTGAPDARASTADVRSGSADARDVTVILDWTPNTNHSGVYVAEANGWYDEAGLNVEIIQPGEQGGLPALASGDADFAFSVQEALTPARTQGAPVVSIAAVIASNTSSLVALADEGIRRPRDLAGRRYGGFGGELETELVRRLVECDGGDPDAVDFVEIGNVDYRVGLERDHFDFVWIFDGWDGIRLRQAGMNVMTLPFADHFDCIPDWYTPLLATSERLIDSDPGLVADFMEVTARGYETAIEDPDAAADALLEAAPELDERLVRESAEYLAGRYRAEDLPWGVQEEQVWREFTDFLQQAGILQGDLAVEDAYTNEFLPSTTASEPADGDGPGERASASEAASP
jgi:ABC-type nitrate/sulfonate/bicarbonate transport system substrate-binding protein